MEPEAVKKSMESKRAFVKGGRSTELCAMRIAVRWLKATITIEAANTTISELIAF